MLVTTLSKFLQDHPAAGYLLAYSGGLDSTVLLHSLATLAAGRTQEHAGLPVRAIHINHGLQPAAEAWVDHCHAVCAGLGVPLQVFVLNLQIPAKASLEAVAREARYRAFSAALHPGEMLLTAHHQDDQAETLLLNLLRGSGVDGLAAMPALRPLGDYQLGRPLLTIPRAQLATYAEQHGLQWIEDPSNQHTEFDRNFLRQQVVPLLRQRWPATGKVLAQAASWQGEHKTLLDDYLQADMAGLRGLAVGTLSVSRLLSLPTAKCKAVLRYWLRQQGLALPPQGRLSAILTSVLTARADASPQVSWVGGEVRRYRDDLFALLPEHDLSAHDPAQVYLWADSTQPLHLPPLGLTVRLADFGWSEPVSAGVALSIRFRRGGERLQRAGRHSVSLKQWFQEQGVPPWQRERIPLLYAGEKLVATACPHFTSGTH